MSTRRRSTYIRLDKEYLSLNEGDEVIVQVGKLKPVKGTIETKTVFQLRRSIEQALELLEGKGEIRSSVSVTTSVATSTLRKALNKLKGIE
jgi:hypothetical protein